MDQFDNVSSTLNSAPGRLAVDDVHVLGSDSQYTGNADDRLHVAWNSGIVTSQTWNKLDVPYYLSSTGAGYYVYGSLNISAGTELIFASGTQMNVRQDGSLTAIGDAANPVIFRGEQATPGYWQGIEFVFSSSVDNVLDHVQITHGGGGDPATSGNIIMDGTGTALARLTLTNSTVSDSLGWGVFLDVDSIFTQSGNTFLNNVSGDINTP